MKRTPALAEIKFSTTGGKKSEELDTLKTQLYTNITHEFRTPLTIILGIARAKELLKGPSNSIATIAPDCGYGDPRYLPGYLNRNTV